MAKHDPFYKQNDNINLQPLRNINKQATNANSHCQCDKTQHFVASALAVWMWHYRKLQNSLQYEAGEV